MAPSGCHWRCDILAASEIDPAPHEPLKPQCVEARYPGSQKRAYFGWTDAGDDGASELAVKFIARFPALIETGPMPAGSPGCWVSPNKAICRHSTPTIW